jgi:hypothetical protein
MIQFRLFPLAALAAVSLTAGACSDLSAPVVRPMANGASFSRSGADSNTVATTPPAPEAAVCETIDRFSVQAGSYKNGLIQAKPTVTSACQTDAYFKVDFTNAQTGVIESTGWGFVSPGFQYSLNITGGVQSSTQYVVTLSTVRTFDAAAPVMATRTVLVTTPATVFVPTP